MAAVKKKYFDERGSLYIRPYRMKDLAAIYGVCARTVRKWMELHGLSEGRKTCKYFSISEVTAIVNALGFPGLMQRPDS